MFFVFRLWHLLSFSLFENACSRFLYDINPRSAIHLSATRTSRLSSNVAASSQSYVLEKGYKTEVFSYCVHVYVGVHKLNPRARKFFIFFVSTSVTCRNIALITERSSYLDIVIILFSLFEIERILQLSVSRARRSRLRKLSRVTK